MIADKFVDLHARNSGLRDKLVAERDVVLTYALHALHDAGVASHLAFKGGTCLRKTVFGSAGRFSEDLDFTLETDEAGDDVLVRLVEVFTHEHHGVAFTFDEYYKTEGDTSFGGDVLYRHAWNDRGRFRLQVSLRERPTLPVTPRPLKPQAYFGHLEFDVFEVRSLDVIEMIAEKVRAAFQRAKVRDLYDLHRFAATPFDGELLRRLVVLKLWQARDPFDPDAFFARLRGGDYDWDDLRRLIRGTDRVDATAVLASIETRFGMLQERAPGRASSRGVPEPPPAGVTIASGLPVLPSWLFRGGLRAPGVERVDARSPPQENPRMRRSPRRPAIRLLTLSLATLLAASPASPCTSILVSKGASADGSTMVTYAADSHGLYGELYLTPAGRHAAGALRDILEWDTGKFLGRIPQAPVTYQTLGNMNEHQVVITETTWGGRKELAEPSGIIDYGSLIWIALERAKTAREAILTMGTLLDEHGYASTGETLSISDPNEVWLMEVIGKGKGRKGAVWVARRVPDGAVSAHANQARIRTFPLADPATTLYAKDVIAFAREMGWFGGRDEEFSFADTYGPLDFGGRRFCEARVWSVFRRAAPSRSLPVAMIQGDPKAERLPLWIEPDRKLSVADVMALMRDHFEGTELDMTKDVGAGPFALPYRWRPMTWEVDGGKYVHERAISTQQTGYSLVSQSRGWLPAPIGGVLWFGLDDTYSTVYMPMYAGMKRVPKSLAVGTADFSRFSWDSAFWVFNFVSNWAYQRYSDMIVDVRKVQGELEAKFLADQAEVEKVALDLHGRAPGLARDYLTDYSVRVADETVARWRKLGETLVWKYLDGNVRDSQGNVTHPKYPDAWYRRIAAERGDALRDQSPED